MDHLLAYWKALPTVYSKFLYLAWFLSYSQFCERDLTLFRDFTWDRNVANFHSVRSQLEGHLSAGKALPPNISPAFNHRQKSTVNFLTDNCLLVKFQPVKTRVCNPNFPVRGNSGNFASCPSLFVAIPQLIRSHAKFEVTEATRGPD